MREQRIKEVEDYIIEKQSVSLKELCQTFNISLNTVRRYINEITADSNIKKIYGGVCVQSPVSSQTSFVERTRTDITLKQAIAKQAAAYIQEHDIIYIDSGTTTMHLLDFVPPQLTITVITGSYHIIHAAIERPNITLICLPGILDRKTLSFGGENSKYLDTLNIHKAFMACTGISVQDGATNSFSAEYSYKKTAVRKADQIYMLADSHKFGVSTLMTYCPLDKINYLITDKMPDHTFCQAMEARQNQIILCECKQTAQEDYE